MNSKIDKEASRDLNKALNLAIASVIGAIIPIVGIILGIIALVISRGVAKSKNNKSKKKTIATVATIGITLSLSAGIAYFAYSSSILNQNKKAQICRDAIEAQGENYYEALLPTGCKDPKNKQRLSEKTIMKPCLLAVFGQPMRLTTNIWRQMLTELAQTAAERKYIICIKTNGTM